MSKVDRTNTIPSSPEDRKRLTGMIKEGVAARIMIAAEQEKMKDIKETILENFPITTKLINQLINFGYNQNFDEVSSERQEIEFAYLQLTEKADDA